MFDFWAVQRKELNDPLLSFFKNRAVGGTLVLWRKYLDPYLSVLPTESVRMKGSKRTEPPGRNNTTAQLEEDPCRQNNKQNRQNNKQNKQNRQNNIVKSKWFH